MSDNYIMDGHKLYWHQDRVGNWLEGKRIAPVHIDVGLSKGCNIRCEYCFGVMQGNLYDKGSQIYFPREPLLRYVRDAGEAGVRSMAFIGEAEPLLNPHVYEALEVAGEAGVDTALGTNGLLFDTGRTGEEALERLSWIRFNISAASQEAYLRIHRSDAFPAVLDKIRFCVETKRKKALKVTIGLQMVLTPSTAGQAIGLAELGREIGADYVVIKQCSDAVNNTLGIFNRLDEYKGFTGQLREAEKRSSGDYRVIVKWKKVENRGKRTYDRCLGVPFLLYSSGDGKVYPCGMFFEEKKEEYCMGDLVTQSFREILAGTRYREVMEKVRQIDVQNECYANCRTHSINEYLWSLTHPPEHVNFI